MVRKEYFRGQNYQAIKKNLIKSGQLFTDAEFVPDMTSLFFSTKKDIPTTIEWKRPGEICEKPRLVEGGIESSDVIQGSLGNCWFVTACSALTHQPQLFAKVLPDPGSQEWDLKKPQNYCGIFHFNFWRFGKWVDVVVDDLLPVQNNQLIFARSKTKNEFWCALLEKAFAKLNGTYESLIGGTLAEALVDLTGGVPETIELKPFVDDDVARLRLFNDLKSEFHDNHALIAAAIAPMSEGEIEKRLPNGLVMGHAYSVCEIKKISLDGHLQGIWDKLFSTPETMMMIRLMNPWGQKEWNGRWSDGSAEWTAVSEDQRNKLGLKIQEDGEFWMNLQDFATNFTDISVCRQINTSFFTLKTRYHEKIFFGAWAVDRTKANLGLKNRAGGCANYRDTFLQNPQFRFDVTEDSSEHPVLISMLQKDIIERRRQGAAYLTIGIHVMKIENNRVTRLHQVMKTVGTSVYINSRSVFLKLENLAKGRYVIVPTTFSPNEEADFMLRLYTTEKANAEELTQDKPKRGCCACCSAEPVCFTRIDLKGAEGLDGAKDDSYPYCIIKCEGVQVKTDYVNKTNSPAFDFSAAFYRKKPDDPIVIEIWNCTSLKQSLFGCAVLKCPVKNDMELMEVKLTTAPKKGKELESRPGTLRLAVGTFDNLVAL